MTDKEYELAMAKVNLREARDMVAYWRDKLKDRKEELAKIEKEG
jgi:hypothetical protein